jgi:hypothetical protein
VIARDLRYPVDGEPELDEQLCQRRRRPECVHADYGAVITDVTVPAQCGGLPHGDACGHRRRQHFVAVLPGLAIEQFPAGHAHYAGTDAVGLQLLAGGQRQTNFRNRCQQNGLGYVAVAAPRRCGWHGSEAASPETPSIMKPRSAAAYTSKFEQCHRIAVVPLGQPTPGDRSAENPRRSTSLPGLFTKSRPRM